MDAGLCQDTSSPHFSAPPPPKLPLGRPGRRARAAAGEQTLLNPARSLLTHTWAKYLVSLGVTKTVAAQWSQNPFPFFQWKFTSCFSPASVRYFRNTAHLRPAQGCLVGTHRPPVRQLTLLAPVSPEVTTPPGRGAQAPVFTCTHPHTPHTHEDQFSCILCGLWSLERHIP